MKALPTTFKRNGFTYTQIVDLHPAYVYEQRRGARIWYEAVRAHQRGARLLKGKLLGAAWQYPASERWGQEGFTCQTLERAMERVGQLNQVAV